MNKKEMFSKLSRPSVNVKRILHITHRDADGYMPVALLTAMFKDAEITRAHVGHQTHDVEAMNAYLTNESTWQEFGFVFVTDMHISCEAAEYIVRNGHDRQIVMLDHHEKALPLNAYSFCCVSMTAPEDSFLYGWKAGRRCDESLDAARKSAGTSLLVDYLDTKFPEQRDRINGLRGYAELVSGYDTWDWVNMFNREPVYNTLNKFFWAVKGDAFVDKMCRQIGAGEPEELFTGDELEAIRKRDEEAAEYANSIIKYCAVVDCLLMGVNRKVAFVMANSFLQEVFSAMMDTYEADVYVVMTEKGLSLRTLNKELNLNTLAQCYGGGGHPGAAGIPLGTKLMESLVRCIFMGKEGGNE